MQAGLQLPVTVTDEPEHTVWPAGAPGTHNPNNPDASRPSSRAAGTSKNLDDLDCHRTVEDRAEHQHLADWRSAGATRLCTPETSSGKQSEKEGAGSSAVSSEGELAAELARGAVLDQAQSKSRFWIFPSFDVLFPNWEEAYLYF